MCHGRAALSVRVRGAVRVECRHTMIGPLTAGRLDELRRGGTVVIDLRTPANFARGHIPGAINLLYGRRYFGHRIAALLAPSPGLTLALVCPPEVVLRSELEHLRAQLEAAGFMPPLGYLAGGMEAWSDVDRPTAVLPTMTHEGYMQSPDRPLVLDVREAEEQAGGIIPGAHCLALASLAVALTAGDDLPVRRERPVAVVCAAGLRSSTAASLLLRHGFRSVANLIEGMNEWQRQGRPTSRPPG